MRLLLLSVLALCLFGQGQGQQGEQGQGNGTSGTNQNTINNDPLTPQQLAENYLIPGVGKAGEGPVNGNGNRGGEGLIDYDWCFVSGDPHACTYRQECASLRLPCRFHMTKLLVKASFNVFVEIDVFVWGGAPHMGRYYVNCVEIQVQILDGSGVGNLDKREDGFGIFTTCCDDLEAARENNETDCWHKTNGDLQNTTLTYYDYATDMAVLTFHENGAAFLFRCVNRSEGIPQSRRPGVISLVTQDLYPEQDARFPGTICSQRNDNRRFSVMRKQPFFDVDNTAQMLAFAVLCQNITQPLAECDAAAYAFQNECGTYARKSAAITTCHNLTSHHMVQCQYDNGDPSGLGWFSDCIVNMCNDVSVDSIFDEAESLCS